MSDSFFDEPYDPVATPNPAYDDDDLEPAPHHRSAWERRSLSQAMLARARARQDAIADAFVKALIDGKFSFFRLLMDLEKAAIAGEAEAQQARQPTLAEILLPMLERERKEAAAAREAAEPESQPAAAPQPTSEPTPARPMLVAPSPTQPGTTDLNAAAPPAPSADPAPNADPGLNTDAARRCRTHTRQRHPQRRSRNPVPPTQSPGQLRTLHACQHSQAPERDSYHHTVQTVQLTPPAHRQRQKSRRANPSKEKSYPPNLTQDASYQQFARG